ncbi:molybdate transport system permease protein [Planifilum fimeticola]|jgi:molybdate transport system permease protein|uniref:Molybdenum transport system permease n=1 Tax=Planifilum fimeticola TaxID=201975 RepID=A0A2T0LE32_9BACL|nr:molybdate ABC transporter permease subunit [Planifilum fimeticola]PRX40338.1 molybdate transport system permease protein [Planifilum fimeticola]
MISTDFWNPILLSFKVNVTASLIAFAAATAFAWWLKDRSFPGKTILETLLMLPLVLPPTVVGFGLLVLLGRNGPVGRFVEWLLHQPVIFTWWAAVVAAAVVAFPLMYQTFKAGFESVDRDLEDAARAMGAGEGQVFRHVTLPLSWRFLLTGTVLGFARGIGEFGATLMVAGNIPGETQTVPTAIYIAVETGRMDLAASWVMAVVFLSFLLLGIVQRMK